MPGDRCNRLAGLVGTSESGPEDPNGDGNAERAQHRNQNQTETAERLHDLRLRLEVEVQPARRRELLAAVLTPPRRAVRPVAGVVINENEIWPIRIPG